MNAALIDRVVNAVLYEGYILYPYRPSATKNRRRFNFGVLVPPAYRDQELGRETSEMRVEVLVTGADEIGIDVTVRFLQVTPSAHWQEATEREVRLEEVRGVRATPKSGRHLTGCTREAP